MGRCDRLPSRYDPGWVHPGGVGCQVDCPGYCLPQWQYDELIRDCPAGTEPFYSGTQWTCRQLRRQPLTTQHVGRDAPARACPAGSVAVCPLHVCERRMRRHNLKPPARCNMACPAGAPAPELCARGGRWQCNRCTGLWGCFVNRPSDRSYVRREGGGEPCPPGHLPVCSAPARCVQEHQCARRCTGKPSADMCLGRLAARCDACTGHYGCVEDE